MGGSGSGRHGRRSTRSRIEDLYAISVGHLAGQGSGTSTAFHAPTGQIRVVSFTLGAATYDLELTSTQQRLGGHRCWLVCPWCRTRRRHLYHVRNTASIACRLCLRLRYTSQCLSRSERWRHQAESLYDRAEHLHMFRSTGQGAKQVQSRVRTLLMRASAYEEAWIRDGMSRVRLPSP